MIILIKIHDFPNKIGQYIIGKRCYEDLHITTHRMMGKPQPNIASFPKISTDIIPSDYKLVDRAKFIREKKQMYMKLHANSPFFFKITRFLAKLPRKKSIKKSTLKRKSCKNGKSSSISPCPSMRKARFSRIWSKFSRFFTDYISKITGLSLGKTSSAFKRQFLRLSTRKTAKFLIIYREILKKTPIKTLRVIYLR